MRLLAVASVLLACVLPVVLAASPGKKKKEKPEAIYGLIGGTVFRDTGMALPGAEVTAVPEDGSAPHKSRKLKAITDRRGEFAIRVPAVPMRYTVTASASRFQPQQKSVSISGEERIDVFLMLESASK